MPSTQLSLNIPPLPSREPASCPNAPVQAPELVRGAALEHYCAGAMQGRTAMVVVEEPLRITVPGREDIILPRTPGDDEHLIAGHLFTLGLIRSHADILDMTFRGNAPAQAVVRLRQTPPRRAPGPLSGGPRIDPEQIFRLRDGFEQRQRLYHSTRATHAAALFKAGGELLAYGEDVSRHCAFDKAVGAALKGRLLTEVDIAMLTSRLASELAAKAAAARIPVLCGFSAATSSGMELAERSGITLIGRMGGDGFTVYANGWRIRS
ncbi:Protein FdhD [Pseudodesulfovibrio hydrargyri]|uniref:Protein FdhD n=1 Tax=Pseudodesulfovibrio hydrargyri TaxID=2125990 RepID=A0A1J5N7U4_9BACT|nr:formate dehydrogenase accessory sulfurtransferase FdhD [Pseudodesulfovibrio hydrargyri]OIQ51699.1 Protein FdhD [Pseudodesulfovibrio hydrargyri]